MNGKTKTLLNAALPLLIALISIFILSDYAASPKSHVDTLAALDAKKTDVMELTAASTAASVAITLIPGDTATPIAEKLADLSTYFLIVVCAIYLEKYLVTITGYAAFLILIPASCVLYAVNVFKKDASWGRLSRKLFLFGVAIFLIIPTSVAVSNFIDKTYQDSIEATMEAAKQTTDDIASADAKDAGDKNFLSGLLSNAKSSVSEAIANAENTLNHFIEALAVMLITSCVIPILVLVFLVWMVRLILGISSPQFPKTD